MEILAFFEDFIILKTTLRRLRMVKQKVWGHFAPKTVKPPWTGRKKLNSYG